jgi:hypothetical protein
MTTLFASQTGSKKSLQKKPPKKKKKKKESKNRSKKNSSQPYRGPSKKNHRVKSQKPVQSTTRVDLWLLDLMLSRDSVSPPAK